MAMDAGQQKKFLINAGTTSSLRNNEEMIARTLAESRAGNAVDLRFDCCSVILKTLWSKGFLQLDGVLLG